MNSHLLTAVGKTCFFSLILIALVSIGNLSVATAQQQPAQTESAQAPAQPKAQPAADPTTAAAPTSPKPETAAAAVPQEPQPATQEAAKPAETLPAVANTPAPEQKADAPASETLPSPTASAKESREPLSPAEYAPLIQKLTAAVMAENFTFAPSKAIDPFAPFIVPESSAPPVLADNGEDEPRADSDKPLTPLQKMTVSEVERGLKAIIWGDLGKKAMIEDATGKGYIVSVGTPACDRNGVVKEIMNDQIVIEQQIWDRMARKRMPQQVVVKLPKKTADKPM